MFCFQSWRSLGSYLDGEIPVSRRRRIEGHLARCRACERRLRDLREARERLADLPEATPPPDLRAKMRGRLRVPAAKPIGCTRAGVLLHARLDGELAPLESARLESHLAGCLFCRREAEAMTRLAQAIAALRPARAPSRVRAQVAASASPAPWARQGEPAGARSLLSLPLVFSRRRLALAAATVTALLGALLLPGLMGRHLPVAPPAGPTAPEMETARLLPAGAGPSSLLVARAAADSRPNPVRPVKAVASRVRTIPLVVAFRTARPEKLEPAPTRKLRAPRYDAEAEEALLTASERDRVTKDGIRLARLPEGLLPPSREPEATSTEEPTTPTTATRPAEVSEAWRARLRGAAERVAHEEPAPVSPPG